MLHYTAYIQADKGIEAIKLYQNASISYNFISNRNYKLDIICLKCLYRNRETTLANRIYAYCKLKNRTERLRLYKKEIFYLTNKDNSPTFYLLSFDK